MVRRTLYEVITKELFKKKAILILGPRQVGKSTLVRMLLDERSEKTLYINADDIDIREDWQNTTSDKLRSMLGDIQILVIDEAQRIENIGITLKQILDNLGGIQVIATGSSSFDLANKINEPLTGRKFEHLLFPFSYSELINATSFLAERRILESRLVYGSYPDIINQPGNEAHLLRQLAGSYLFKDILSFDGVKKPPLLDKLIRLLSLQIGSEVSYEELGREAGADKTTIERYIDLLEKAFIVFKLNSFSRNVRNEIKKGKKIFFYDNGIRNSVIGNFNSLPNRSDKGALWESYLISERKKLLSYNEVLDISYFWRTTQQQEIDYIEEREGMLYAYEFKWKNQHSRFPATFLKAYPGAILKIIDNKNYADFLTKI